MFDWMRREVELSAENATLRRDLSIAQRDLATVLLAKQQEVQTPICIHGSITEVPLYWVRERDHFAKWREGKRGEEYYTESAEKAFQAVQDGMLASLVRGYKTEDGRITLKDPRTIGVEVLKLRSGS